MKFYILRILKPYSKRVQPRGQAASSGVFHQKVSRLGNTAPNWQRYSSAVPMRVFLGGRGKRREQSSVAPVNNTNGGNSAVTTNNPRGGNIGGGAGEGKKTTIRAKQNQVSYKKEFPNKIILNFNSD